METQITDTDLVAMMQRGAHSEISHGPAIAPAPLPGELPPTINQLEEIRYGDDVEPRPSFGEWLLAQKDRKGWIGDLGKAAKADRDFPKRGSPDDVRKRLQQMGADGDVFEALDDAEMDWAGF
jgi:hypothetical protein